MKISKETDKILNFQFKQILKDNDINNLDQLYTYLYPYDSNPDNIVLRKRWFDKPKSTLMNRINTLWVYPIFITSIPFRFVMFGDFYVNKDTKFGKVLKYLLGDF